MSFAKPLHDGHASLDARSLEVVSKVGLDSSDLAISLLEQSQDCVKILSVDGRLDFMNCNGMDAMEIDDPDQVLGQLWWHLWPDHAQVMVKNKFHAARNGRTVQFEASCPTVKGNPRRWSVNLKPMLAAAGPVVLVLATSREIGRAR